MKNHNTHQKLLEDHLQGIRRQIETITDSLDMQALCNSFLADAVAGISDLKSITQHEAHHQIDVLALSFASLATCLSTHLAGQIKEAEERKRYDVEMKKDIHDLVVGVAQAKAVAEWEKDSGQKIRIGGMSEKVWAAMIDGGFTDYLPSNRDRLKKWIAPVAPDYAREAGRPKKTK